MTSRPAPAPAVTPIGYRIEVWDYEMQQWELIEVHDERDDALRQVEHHLDAVTQSAVLLGLTPGGTRVLDYCNDTIWELM